jgi:hypothetical protein
MKIAAKLNPALLRSCRTANLTSCSVCSTNGHRASFTIVFLSRFHSAQLQQGTPPRLFLGHPQSQIVLNVQLQMALDFIRQLPFPLLIR